MRVAWAIWRGAGGTAIQTLEAANRVLEARVRQLGAQNLEQARQIAALQGKTDFAASIAPLVQELERHEVNAGKRHSALIDTLDTLYKTFEAHDAGGDP